MRNIMSKNFHLILNRCLILTSSEKKFRVRYLKKGDRHLFWQPPLFRVISRTDFRGLFLDKRYCLAFLNKFTLWSDSLDDLTWP